MPHWQKATLDVFACAVPGSYGWYRYYNGCSAACPHVAGVAALVFSKNPSLTNDQIRAILNLTSDDLGTQGWDQFYGYGKINAYNAVSSASSGIVSSDSAVLWVYNSSAATGNLNVSAITHNYAWIISVGPTSFAVGPSDSIGVKVVVNSSGLSSGTYYDTLYIFSDDPDENPYAIPVILQHLVGIEETEKTTQVPVVNLLYHTNPNPFRDKIDIRFSIGQSAELKVFNAAGRLVRQYDYSTIRLLDQITWDARDDKGRKMSAGIYFVRLESGGFKQTQKVILLK